MAETAHSGVYVSPPNWLSGRVAMLNSVFEQRRCAERATHCAVGGCRWMAAGGGGSVRATAGMSRLARLGGSVTPVTR
jgi:hypothetical protein